MSLPVCSPSSRPLSHRQRRSTSSRWRLAGLMVAVLAGLGATPATATTLGGCPVFPRTAIFNTPINDTAAFPVHAQSSAWRSLIRTDGGANLHLHLDLGRNEDPDQIDTYWGIPFNLVDGSPATTQWLPFSFQPTDANDDMAGWPDESDCARPKTGGGYKIKRGCQGVATPQFPFPLDGARKIEGGTCDMAAGDGCVYNDRHLLVLDSGSCRLWESYYTYLGREGWHHSGVSAWNLKSNAMRPDGWTSADAAGLPILPLLLRAEEADSGEITHALRVTFRNGVMRNQYVWPASHQAGYSPPQNIPFGALLRLRADFQIPASWNVQAKAMARAMQVYGLYVADNGSDLYVQGEPNARWKASTIEQLQGGLTLDQFDFVDLSSITSRPDFDPRSYRAR